MPLSYPLVQLLIAGVVGFFLFAGLAWVRPTVLTWPFRCLVRCVYRLHVYQTEKVPLSGPVLIVSNHLSYIDWLIFWVASLRPLTFVLWNGFANRWYLKPFLGFVRHRLITVENSPGRPHAIHDALQKVAKALDNGEAVLVFAEGSMSRNGQMLPFGRGIEKIQALCQQPVTILPAYIDNLWGSFFSYYGGKPFSAKPWPLRRRVSVCFGEPLESPANVAEVRAAVVETGADCAILDSEHLPTPARSMIDNACRWRNIRRPAIIDLATGTERILPWSKVLVGAWCLSSWLKSKLKPAPCVGIWLPTGLGSSLANFALALLGKTTANLNYTAGKAPVEAAIRRAEIRQVISSKRFLERMPAEFPEDTEIILLEDALAAITNRQRLIRFLMVVLCPGWLVARWIGVPPAKPDDTLTIIFSSGSTGEPKGVVLTHRNISGNADGFVRGVELRQDDRMLATLPFFHSFGYTVCLWAPAILGMSAVYYPDPRAAREVGELCAKYRCSIMLGTATFLRFYLRRCQPTDFRSLRLLICGAEKLPVSLALEFKERFGILPLEGYGCTETSPVVSTNLRDVHSGKINQVANRLGTVGQPIPGVAVKSFDPETYEPLPPNTDGILGVKGPNVMPGYLDQPEQTAKVIRNGWYMTGDYGRVEPDGFIRITGRLSRFAKIAGEMVPVERIEEELHELLETAGERVLAVATMPCERRGERLVVLHLEQIHLRLEPAFGKLREKGIPNLWVPDVRDCFCVESFPVLGSGKLDLRGLAELARQLADRLERSSKGA